MKRLKLAVMAVALTASQAAVAGGLLTNTNQNVAFNRHFSRDAAIGIDGVYSNPAGVAFMNPGAHLSINWQLVFQTRTIQNEYPLFANNTANASTRRKFQGKAFAPVLPSFQFAYNWKKFSFQSNFAVGGGGGKCTFDDGLGSFEKIVGETAVGACALAGAIDQTMGARLFTDDAHFGSKGSYSFDSYMRGRQYYYGLSLGAAYRFNPSLSVFAGVRGVYAMSNYYGYVRNIKVGRVPLYRMLDPTKTNSADIELNSDQTGVGFTPILSVDYKLGRWNFAAKYEFKTRMRLKTESVNQAPSIGNLPANLMAAFKEAGVSEAAAAAVLNAPAVANTMMALDRRVRGRQEDCSRHSRPAHGRRGLQPHRPPAPQCRLPLLLGQAGHGLRPPGGQALSRHHGVERRGRIRRQQDGDGERRMAEHQLRTHAGVHGRQVVCDQLQLHRRRRPAAHFQENERQRSLLLHALRTREDQRNHGRRQLHGRLHPHEPRVRRGPGHRLLRP